MPSYSKKELDDIYNKTEGYCNITGIKLSRINYSNPDGRCQWTVDHSNARVKGGSDLSRNLFPVSAPINRMKGDKSTRTARRWFGRTGPPLTKQEKQVKRLLNTAGFGLLGFGVGVIIKKSPWLAALGTSAGAWFGYTRNPGR